jgi:hypothetical protein
LNDAKGLTLALKTNLARPLGLTSSDMFPTNDKISGIFDFTFQLNPGVDINPNTYVLIKLPGYDTMFIPPEDTILCYIDDGITPCTRYEGIDWILLKTETG